MARVTPVLWKRKTNKKGLAPIYLRISDSARTRYVSLRVLVRPSQWNENSGGLRKGHKRAEELNNLIARRVAEAEEEILRLKAEKKAATADRLKRVLASSREEAAITDFFAFADRIIEDSGRAGRGRHGGGEPGGSGSGTWCACRCVSMMGARVRSGWAAAGRPPRSRSEARRTQTLVMARPRTPVAGSQQRATHPARGHGLRHTDGLWKTTRTPPCPVRRPRGVARR
ncbi:MAG: Arm DNA-binding domain-containing protein, partial [Rubricoccaceae bacterium]|nr:Arm DNA-binding domain-containing protein [Rubricoccaceae bacterium]